MSSARLDVLNLGQPIGEDWNVYSVNTIQVPKKREPECVWCSMLKGTVSPDYKCLEVISIKSPLLGHVTPDIKKF